MYIFIYRVESLNSYLILYYLISFSNLGGRFAAQYVKKARTGAICGDCKLSLPGIKHMDARGFKNAHKREKTVSRAYGGSRCATCVRQR